MNAVQVFTNDEFGSVRTIAINGEPWFVGKDVAEKLGYSKARKAIADHVDEEDKKHSYGVTIRDSTGREQKPIVINESGMYSLVLGSKLPAANKFKHWITSEVIPSIRMNGGYITGQENIEGRVMNELIKVTYDGEEPTVSARKLHEILGISKRFSAWFDTNAQGFVENEDFKGVYLKVQGNQYGGEQAIQDYSITVDMAKHICLMSRTEKGKECRQYLIDLEKAWNTPELVMARALKMADKKIHVLEAENEKHKEVIAQQAQKIEADRPKTIFADAVSTSKTSIMIGDLAKLICQNGHQIGQKRLFQWMRDHGYLMKVGASYNMPTQRYMEQGLFEVKERSIQNPDGSVRITKTTTITGKGQLYFINKFLNKDEIKKEG